MGGKSEISSSKGEEDKENVVGHLVHDEIPTDLKFEILNRLEAKSLMRFRCVSNEWLSIIRSQVFINSFNTVSQTRSPRFLVSARNAENRAFLLSSSHFETERSNTCLESLVNPKKVTDNYLYNKFKFVLRATSLDTNLAMTMDGLDLVQCSSVHGLFGFSQPSHPGRFMIFNPSTRQLITLPDIKARKNGIHMFLGYDPVGNVYKAMCSFISHCGRIQVYKVLTLGEENLSWRNIGKEKKVLYNIVTNKICLNGKVYFGGWTLTQEKIPVMICFDVRDEQISCGRVFSSVLRDGSLINYNGKLGSVVHSKYQPHIRFDIFVLDDSSKGIWLLKEILFHPILPDISRETKLNIIGMSKADEFVFVPSKLPRKGEPLYIYYYRRGVCEVFVRRVKFDGFEEFGCNHASDDEQCDCQLFFSPEHFETLLSL